MPLPGGRLPVIVGGRGPMRGVGVGAGRFVLAGRVGVGDAAGDAVGEGVTDGLGFGVGEVVGDGVGVLTLAFRFVLRLVLKFELACSC